MNSNIIFIYGLSNFYADLIIIQDYRHKVNNLHNSSELYIIITVYRTLRNEMKIIRMETFMQKGKRIIAMLGLIVLVGLYITTFVASLFHSTFSSQLFMASLYCSFIVPIMIYVYTLIYRVFKGDKKNDSNSNKTEK